VKYVEIRLFQLTEYSRIYRIFAGIDICHKLAVSSFSSMNWPSSIIKY
jgi:hypothetical protein